MEYWGSGPFIYFSDGCFVFKNLSRALLKKEPVQ